ncbi:hypothetical protein BH10BAC2_BH10BAC2_28160 [soil metagenome]
MENEFEYLRKRAILFFKYLDHNEIINIFPERDASIKELEDIIASGSLRKLKIHNDIIDNLIIGKSSLSIETKDDIISFLKKT